MQAHSHTSPLLLILQSYIILWKTTNFIEKINEITVKFYKNVFMCIKSSKKQLDSDDNNRLQAVAEDNFNILLVQGNETG